MNGFEAVKAIRELGYTGLIFGVTGSANENDTKLFYENGVNKVLEKPLNLKLLREIINLYGINVSNVIR